MPAGFGRGPFRPERLRARSSPETLMLKLVLAFVVFAAVAIFVVLKGGDKLSMAGESGGDHAVAAPASASAPASAASH